MLMIRVVAKRPKRSRWSLTVATLLLTLAGCAAPPPQTTSPAAPGATEPSRPQRTLVIAEGREIDTLGRFGDRTDNEPHDMVQAGLAVRNQTTFAEQPWMAEELPSMEKGAWRVNPD